MSERSAKMFKTKIEKIEQIQSYSNNKRVPSNNMLFPI